MRKTRTNKQSIMSYFTILTILIIFLQVLLMLAMLIWGGVFKQTKANAYKSLSDTTNNRKSFIAQEMENRWTNFRPYLSNIQREIGDRDMDNEEILQLSTENLISMLRTTGATGVYIILGNPIEVNSKYDALYLRDYDPISNSYKNDDIHMLYGGPGLARKYKLPLDANWEYNFLLTEENKFFFTRPYKGASYSVGANHVGYWSRPFRIFQEDTPIITYSIPLQTVSGDILGIIGIELRVDYIAKFLPAKELQTKNSLGYIVATKNLEDKSFNLLISTNNIQKRFIDEREPLIFETIDGETDVQILTNNKMKDDIYGAISKLDIYPYTSPFEEEWYIIGFMNSEDLFRYVNKVIHTLEFSLFITLFLGIIGAVFASFQMSKPVLGLIEEITLADINKPLKLKTTNLLELDQLSDAIIKTNKSMMDSASRLSRIIEMVGLPLTAFEIRNDSSKVLVTDNFFAFMESLEIFIDEDIIENKVNFNKFLLDIISNPEPEERRVYRVGEGIDRWFKISTRTFDNQINGIFQDVTKEIVEKNIIKKERDLDPLTEILNRKSFKCRFMDWYGGKNNKIAALIMFDLDNLKLINDSYGHKWGDFYILEAVKHLESIATTDKFILGRRSGDEFIMLLYDFRSKEEIYDLLKDFYERLSKHVLYFPNGDTRSIKISSGFAWIENNELTYDQLLHYADEAMYYTKRYNKGYFTEGKSIRGR